MSNARRSGPLGRRIGFWAVAIVVLGIAAYTFAAFATKQKLEDAGKALGRSISGADVDTTALSPGSVVLLGSDTIAELVAEAHLSEGASAPQSRLYIGHVLDTTRDRLAPLADYVAMRQTNARRAHHEEMQLVPRSEIRGAIRYGTLLIRASNDTMLRTFPVFAKGG